MRAISVWQILFLFLLALHVLVLNALPEWPLEYSLFNKTLGFAWIVLFYVVVASAVRNVEGVIRILRYVILGAVALGFVLVAFGALVGQVGDSDLFSRSGRFYGLSYKPGPYGAYLSALAIVALAFTMFKVRILWGGLGDTFIFILLLVLAVLTGSRSSFIGLTLGLVFVLLAHLRDRGLQYGKMLLRILIVIPLGIWAFARVTGVVQYQNPLDRQFTIDARQGLNEAAWDAFVRNPVLGEGLSVPLMTQTANTHNSLLWIASELGLVGVALMVGMFYWIIRRIATIAPTDTVNLDSVVATNAVRRALLGTGVVYFGFSMGVETLYQRGLWFFLALGVGLWIVGREQPGTLDASPNGGETNAIRSGSSSPTRRQ
jgi:O-antigen ligase